MKNRINVRFLKTMSTLGKTGAAAVAAALLVCAVFAQPQQPQPLSADSPRAAAAPREAEAGKGAEMGKSVLPTMSKSAADALTSGMPSLAEAMAQRVFENPNADARLKSEARRTLIDAYISQGKFADAERYLASAAEKTDSDLAREALVLTGLGRRADAERIVSALSENPADAEYNSWLAMAKGYIAFSKGDYSAAISDFEKAKKYTGGGFFAIDAEIAINSCKISLQNTPEQDEKLEKELEEKVSLYLGTPAGFQFAKQYAGLLFKMGKVERALEVINAQLEIELADSVDKDELRLIGAAINPNLEKRLSALKDIMSTSASANVVDFALALYVRDSKDSPAVQSEFLENLAKNGAPAIRDRILLEISKNALKTRDYKTAQECARRILDDYPASPHKQYALRILAWIAFNGETARAPQYRLAASYLESLAALEKDPKRAAKIKMLAADCYFLNQDYAGAGKIYDELIDSDSENRATLTDHAIEALLMQNRVSDAIALLSRLQSEDKIDEGALWNSAWRILTQYRKNSGDAKTLENIEKVLENNTDMSPSLRIKMLWLRARITEENGDNARVAKLCRQLEGEIDAAGEGVSNAPDIRQVRANAMLMSGRALERLGDFEGENGAFKTYERLRRQFPDSDAAQLSYLYQASGLALLERFNAARALCLKLAEEFPRGKYLYPALFDAAEYSRRMGMDSNYRTALSLLDRLCREFPDNPRNFYAKLSQAEILRMMNAFADARTMYNDIINTYSSHPEIYLAWMGLGDSTLAVPARAKDAAAIFERLYALPSLDEAARAEAAFKWAFALASSGEASEADEVRWITSQALLENPKISAAARYWIGRSLFDMARSLESAGRMRDARAAYELIASHNLPPAKIARQKLGAKKKE